MAEQKHIWYAVGDDWESRYRLKWVYGFSVHGELEIAAEDAADDYHNRHDGWEATWPLTFAIFQTTGPRLAAARLRGKACRSFMPLALSSRRIDGPPGRSRPDGIA